MLGQDPFFFDTITTMTSAFGTMFNEIYIKRTNPSSNATTQVIKVPLVYSGKDRQLTRVDEDPEIQKSALVLPRMSFSFKGLSYDGNRKLQTSGRKVMTDSADANKFRRQYNPVAYNFFYELNILSDNVRDGLKIVEQILPRFTPDWTMTLRMIDEFEQDVDIPFIIQDPQFMDNFEGNFQSERRTTEWTIPFVAKGYLWGPIKSKPIIKYAYQNFYIGVDSDEIVGTTSIRPGLTANGQPTANSSESVNTSIITVTDDYGFIESANGVIFGDEAR